MSTSTIKMSLNRFIKPEYLEAITNEIKNDVNILSTLMVEASIYIHFVWKIMLTTGETEYFRQPLNKFNFYREFRCLTTLASDENRMHPQYANIRNPFNLPMHDVESKTNQLNFAADEFKRNTATNIWFHAKSRIKHFLKNANPDVAKIDVKIAVKWLFSDSQKRQELGNRLNLNLIESLRTHLRYTDDLNFYRIKFDWLRFIPLFYNLQVYNNTNGKKTSS